MTAKQAYIFLSTKVTVHSFLVSIWVYMKQFWCGLWSSQYVTKLGNLDSFPICSAFPSRCSFQLSCSWDEVEKKNAGEVLGHNPVGAEFGVCTCAGVGLLAVSVVKMHFYMWKLSSFGCCTAAILVWTGSNLQDVAKSLGFRSLFQVSSQKKKKQEIQKGYSNKH